MRIGITLPSFSGDAGKVLETARQAEDAGLHGVFVFDHLWPIGDPGRPALSLYPLAGGVLATTRRVQVGSFVARLGLLPDEVVLASIGGLAEIGGERLIAAVGTGDSASAEEHFRLGIPMLSAELRREKLRRVATGLGLAGLETWVGGGTKLTNAISLETGSTLNLWGASPETVAEAVAVAAMTPPGRSAVTWGGPLPKATSEAAERLVALRDAGATWAVWGWPGSVGAVVEAAGAAGIELS